MRQHWREQHERGSRNAIRLIIWLAVHGGRALCRVLLAPICAYFFLTAPLTRRASQAFLHRALGRRAIWRDTFKHLFVFATTLLDRVYLLQGRQRELSIEVSNEAAFWQALAAGRGCLLLGSHLGSFEMLSIIGSVEKKLVINVVMHLDDSASLRKLLASAQHTLPYNLIPLGHPGSMLQVKECLARGEVVGILADRVFGDEPTQSLPFLGQAARFSLSPLRLAKITGAPVVMVFGLFRGGRRYEIVFETLAERIEGAENAKLAGLIPYLQSYVTCLERQARRCPYNWFNFYDFWREI